MGCGGFHQAEGRDPGNQVFRAESRRPLRRACVTGRGGFQQPGCGGEDKAGTDGRKSSKHCRSVTRSLIVFSVLLVRSWEFSPNGTSCVLTRGSAGPWPVRGRASCPSPPLGIGLAGCQFQVRWPLGGALSPLAPLSLQRGGLRCPQSWQLASPKARGERARGRQTDRQKEGLGVT